MASPSAARKSAAVRSTSKAPARTAPPPTRTESFAPPRDGNGAPAAAASQTRAFDTNPWASFWSSAAASMPGGGELPKLGLGISIPPQKLIELQQSYMQRLGQLWTEFLEQPGKAAEPIKDNRFSDSAWQQNPIASFYARTYLLNSDFLNQMAASVEAEPKTKKRVQFAVSQFVDALSPSNFLALNPKVQKTLIETKGASLTAGMKNLLEDIKKGRITQSDQSAFEIGKNVATSEGAVVFETPLIQLIQYKPLTEKVRQRPILLIPPAINKFYLMDLQPENSFVRFATEQGFTVFLTSWKNIKKDQAKMTWDDYCELGPIAAIKAVQDISGQKQINTLGFCVGGTILGSALAVMAARGEQPSSSVTLMTSLLDFEDAGVLEIFIDEQHVRMKEQALAKGGVMPGKDLGNTFSILRANDLVWNYVVSNYLEGKQPMAFDLLYWNQDSTNLPGPMYTWYLRNMYLENNLRIANKLKVCGQPIDLSSIKAPAYAFSAVEDHIVPWKAGYASARLLGGGKPDNVRFVLGASGHIAGSINPASKNKRSFRTAPDGPLPANSDAWLHNSTEQQGSWWNDWAKWLHSHSGNWVPAPKKYGNAKHKVIEPAPGRYVKEKA